MIPLRKALIVNEHGTLPYPEGTACAEVLLAGEEGGDKAKTTFIGLGIGAVYKFIQGGLGLFPGNISTTIKGYRGAEVGADTMPALLGVGFIIGSKIASYMLAGAVIGWLCLIPLISNIGQFGEVIMYPATVPISQLSPGKIWDSYIRYIGAGAVAFGGVFSLIKSIPLIFTTFKDSMKDLIGRKGGEATLRTDKDIPMTIVIIGVLVLILIMAMLPIIPVGILGAAIIAVFGFFFATVSSRIVGLIGSSSNPVSGMTIATLIITAILFKATGNDGQTGMIATLTVGSVICIIAAMAGDTSQDLKTGYLLGATPYKQQYGELIGAFVSALAIAWLLVLFNQAWGFESAELPAPQAALMRLVVEGVMGGNLPWALVFSGAAIGVAIELLGLPVLPIAIGLYLPISLSTPIMMGGIVRGILDRRLKKLDNNDASTREKIESGILYASGLIAGEGLIGVLLAVFAVFGVNLALGVDLGQIGSIILFGLLILSLAKYSIWKKTKKE